MSPDLLVGALLACVLMALPPVISAAPEPAPPSCAHGALPPLAGCGPRSPIARSVPQHDLQVASSAVQAVANVSVLLSALAPAGTAISAYNWSFGDGSSQTGAGSVVTHTYAHPGWYAVLVNGTDSAGTPHDNLQAIRYLEVAPTFGGDAAGTLAQLAGNFLANSSWTGSGTTGILAQGSWVQVHVWVENAPTAPGTGLSAPRFLLPVPASGPPWSEGVTSEPNASSTANVSVPALTPAGLYVLRYEVNTSGAASPVDSEYDFSIVVGAGDAGSVAAGPTSSHPGTLVVDEANGPYSSLDPALEYDSVSNELVQNIYETLIMPNGSEVGPSPADFLPALTTCVPGPGSASCQALYGSTLYNSTTNAYTFPISTAARFYDPHTRANWPVYPSDVLFSLIRTMGFADLPGAGFYNGWMISQALLPGLGSYPGEANQSWDAGLHAPYNNTPSHIFASILVNSSAYCSAPIELRSNGCVTFLVQGQSYLWPFFLQLVSNSEGAAVVPCGWGSASGATGGQDGIPYWTAGNVSGAGDHPCLLPVGANSTDSVAFATAVATIPSTGWDQWEIAGTTTSGPPPGRIAVDSVGSGPYALVNASARTTVDLAANPAFAANPDCSWAGCLPAPASYLRLVQVQDENGTAAGLAGLANGSVDLAETAPTDAGALLADVESGRTWVRSIPSLDTDFFTVNLEYNESALANLTGTNYTAPSQFLVDPDLRQFLLHALPYGSEASGNSPTSAFGNGLVETRFAQGGAIPSLLGGETPANVSWPAGNLATDPSVVGGAAWWWNRTSHDASAGVNCTVIAPCTFPIAYATGDSIDQELAIDWSAAIRNLSSGALAPTPVNLSFLSIALGIEFSAPGANPFPIGPLGWVPDYPDPSDYANAEITDFGIYPYADALSTLLPTLNGGSCSSAPGYWSSLGSPIPYACQGAAYAAMEQLVYDANQAPISAQRNLEYDMAEQIEERLGLYASAGQTTSVYASAPWIDPASLDVNPIEGGVTSQRFWEIQYRASSGGAPQPLTANLYAPSLTTDAGHALSLSALVSGGVPPYSFEWQFGDGTAAASASVNHTYGAAGRFPIQLWVNDSVGASRLVSATAIVAASPVATLLTSTPTTYAGVLLNLSVDVLGGTGPYSYAYSGLPVGCASSNSSVITCRPTLPGGPDTAAVSVHDLLGEVSNSTRSLTVEGDPVISAFVALPAAPTVGTPFGLSVSVDFGTAPYTYAYAGLPSGCASSDVAVLRCTPMRAGALALNVTVTDAVGFVLHAPLNLTVSNATPPSHPTSSSPPSELFYYVLGAGVAAAVVIAALALFWRRRRATAPSPDTEPPAGPEPPFDG